MNKLNFTLGLLMLFLINACADRKLQTTSNQNSETLSKVHQMMTGEFSSAAQAQEDSLFYDINLVMYPIWEKDAQTKWLYVEQAVTRSLDKPYRQRVYKLSLQADQRIASSVYELKNPAQYIHAWNKPELFQQLSPDSLVLRSGCAVFLQKDGDCFTGATHDKDCKSSLRGASYATSKVSICQDEIVSWDQGWNGEDQQVWGATTKGYIFKRK